MTVHGSVNSHTAILARTMSIPALIGTDVALDETIDGKFAVVDGTNGVLYVEPDEETLETMRRRQREEQEKKELLQTLKGRETVTMDGKEIRLYANIGNSKIWRRSFRTMRRASDCSAANFCIWKKKHFRRKRSSSRYINR